MVDNNLALKPYQQNAELRQMAEVSIMGGSPRSFHDDDRVSVELDGKIKIENTRGYGVAMSDLEGSGVLLSNPKLEKNL